MKLLRILNFFFVTSLFCSSASCMQAGGDSKKLSSRARVSTLSKAFEQLSLVQTTESSKPDNPAPEFTLESPVEEKLFSTIQDLRSDAYAPHKIHEFIRTCIDDQEAGKASGYSKDALIACFKKCKAQGFDFSLIGNERGETVMHVAADKGDPYVIMLFVQAGSSSCPRTNSGGTPLQCAAFHARERTARFLVRTLLQEGGDIDYTDGFGMTALHWLAYGTNPPKPDAQKDSNVAATPKVQEADEKTLTALLDAKASVMKTDWLGRTPLHWATRNGRQGLVDGLLKHVNDEQFLALFGAPDKDGWTPLHGAAFFKHDAVVVALQRRYTYCCMKSLKCLEGLPETLLLLIIDYEYSVT